MRLPYKIYSYKKTWLWKSKILKFISYLQKIVFLIKTFFTEEKNKIKSTTNYLKLTIWSIIKAIILVLFLFTIEHYISKYWIIYFKVFPSWLVELQKIIPKPTYPEDRDVIIELISVIASVTGVILALFYPILATIASTAYAKVHASIRNLLLQEKNTQGFLRNLTYLTACSILVLLFMSFHILPGNLILCFLVFYSFITLFGILKIGMGVYNFFEPSTLVGIVIPELIKSIDDVTNESQNYNNGEFQNFNYRITYEQIGNLSLITNLCVKDGELKESSFKSIIRPTLLLLNYYFSKKRKIPLDSLWFPKIYNHQSYFEVDSTDRELSKNTNTFIRANTKQNHFWFEENITSNISNAIEIIVKNGHINTFGQTILMFHPTFNSLSNSIDLKTGKIILDRLLQNIKLINQRKDNEHIIYSYDDWKYEIGTIEAYSYAILKFQLGVFDRIIEFDSSKFNREYDKINWSDKNTIYTTDYIPELYFHLDRYHKHIMNEIYVEGKIITPDWYLKQAITAEYLGVISRKLHDTIEVFDSYLITVANDFYFEGNPLLSSYIALIGLEGIHKFNFRITSLKKVFNDVDKLEICKKEMLWSKPDFESIEKLIKHYEIQCNSIISKNINKLSTIRWTNQYPDIFGQSYSILSSVLDECFLNNDLTRFEQHFAPFLESAINASMNLKETFKHYSNPENISFQTLIDVMQISGYAYIYSIIYNESKYWQITTDGWNKIFKKYENIIMVLTSHYVFYKNNLHGVGINYNEKSQREKTYFNVVKKLELSIDDVDDIYVKYCFPDTDRYMMLEDTTELFLENYVFTFIEAKEATQLLKRRSIFDKIVRHFK